VGIFGAISLARAYALFSGKLPIVSPAAMFVPPNTIEWLAIRASSPMVVGASVTSSKWLLEWACE
jgi:hypothetical protein